ncbi:MAG: retron St85 family RNA-directed DNA polymerase [Mucilaginibacter sp.]
MVMTFDNFEKNFRVKASKSGYSEDEILKCLNYAKPLLEKNLPIIYNTSNLSVLVGYKKVYLKRAALFTNFFYRRFAIKKKNNKLRNLSEPLPSLKEIQIWILNNILYNIPISKFAKAYVPNKNILDNTRYHRNKEKVLCLDIKDFFPSIKRASVENIFRGRGYSSNVSNLLSKLCCCDESLPQGAPTSPYLSNIYLNNFDLVISEYCIQKSVRYTRYADDLTFSGDFDEQRLIDLTIKELEKIGLTLNQNKISVMGRDDRQLVTGLVVNKVIQIPRFQRDEIRKEIYYIQKFGLEEHLNRIANTRSNYMKHLIGKIDYAVFINPKDEEMQDYKVYLYKNFIKST